MARARVGRLRRAFNAFVAGTRWLKTPQVLPHAQPCWLALPIMVDRKAPFTRAELTSYLETAGVETRPVVTGNVALTIDSRKFRAVQHKNKQGRPYQAPSAREY